MEDKKLLDRLARVEGQIRGVRQMLENGRTCEDVLTQVLAARSGLEKASLILLERHLSECVVGPAEIGDARWDQLRETLHMWSRHAPG